MKCVGTTIGTSRPRPPAMSSPKARDARNVFHSSSLIAASCFLISIARRVLASIMRMASTDVPVLLITGPLGVGKTTILDAVADRLRAAGAPFAAVDLDALAWAYPPATGDDPYRSPLMFRKLASVRLN